MPVCRNVHGENVENDVQTAIWIKVERAYQARDTLPSYLRPLLCFDEAFYWCCCRGIVGRTKISYEVRGELRIPLRLLAE